jgi:hypothetical protein
MNAKPYQILGPLGKGKFATVYKAQLGQELYALKKVVVSSSPLSRSIISLFTLLLSVLLSILLYSYSPQSPYSHSISPSCSSPSY